jgi:exonuclease sbcCD, D subunit
MKFLQIGDLHLGKKLYEFSLHDDQRFMLEQIISLLQSDKYDALLITGDIYEQAMPSQEAMSLFGSFLETIRSELPHISVFIIAGNHDSTMRLSYAREIFKTQNIFIQSTFDESYEPIIFEAGNERCAFFLLPFLQQSFFKAKKVSYGVTNQAEILSEVSDFLKTKIKCDMPNVLLAHVYTAPSVETDSQFRGTVEFVSPELFDFFDYVALGHIHSFLKVTDRMYYAGSPFAYSFDEVQNNKYKKFALAIELNCCEKNPQPVVTKLEIQQLHRLQILGGTFADFLATDKFDAFRDNYLQLELENSEAVESPMQLLHKKFPLIMHIKQKQFENTVIHNLMEHNIETLAEKDFETIFKLFINEIESETDDDETKLAKSFWNAKECE